MAQNYHTFIDISVFDRKIRSIQEEIDLTPHSIGYLEFLDKNIDFSVIRFGANLQEQKPFFLYRYHFGDLLRAYRLFMSKKNAVVLFHGFSFPIRFYLLSALFGKRFKWIIQHHAGNPSENRLKRAIQKKCYSRADCYLFVSVEQAQPFVAAGLVRSESQVREIMECSTGFVLKNKQVCRDILKIDHDRMTFIWVGDLDENKDPFCMLEALSSYKKAGNEFVAYMFFAESNLLPIMKSFIAENDLAGDIILKGKVDNKELENWFNAADYFISCSHSEGSGIALAEAMACGCIPLVSNIPSFVQMTAGSAALLFEKGNSNSLLKLLLSLNTSEIELNRLETRQVFNDELSFEAIGRKTSAVIAEFYQ
ncbi:MAG: hypothetical protein CFE23_00750 [Flavobacterium sp. BFFFF1]|uniref:glycosyltransferase n=1 Tax=Flavobacterium sp. BFFFF1 TaxID=2015557 RepID=UPI000BC8B002|nr:glycosyltransferase [Flavobacterium sp. BFFFF1]OYU82279.1 MAG: hypothetical protein CFE23_00750 [Flavobacterium sp. BFFFF1]